MKISPVSWLFFILYYWLCLSFHISMGSSLCLDDQKFLLLQLKKDLIFNSTNSNKLKFWNESIPCRHWRGITWDEKGHVTGLDLSGEMINGGFDNSSSLFNLQYLKNLNLAGNDFDFVIPSRIGNLKNLNSLNLSEAHFRKQIPMEISQLTRLVVLDITTKLGDLKLDSPNLVKLIQNLTEVRELYLDGVSISLEGNEWGRPLSSSLPHLQVLSMSFCNLSGPIDSSLGMLKNLSIIRLNGNNLSAPVPEFFATFLNLTHLELSFCGLSGWFPEQIFQVHSLATLDLSSNYELQVSLPHSSLNGSLRALILSKTSFSRTQLDSLSNLNMLTYLDLSSNNLSGGIPLPLFSLPYLLTIDLSNNHFQGQLNEISNISSSMLENLDLSSNNLEGPIPHFIVHLKQLQILQLSSNNFSGAIPNGIWELGALSLLNLSHNSLQEIERPTHHLSPTLYVLDLNHNNLEGTLPEFPKYANYLDLSFNKFYSGIPIDVGNSSNLRFLSLSNNALYGRIPKSICNVSDLQVLDLSFNNIDGMIPRCLVESETHRALIVGKNNLTGNIPDTFQASCALLTLDLSSNNLQGQIPKSLSNCTRLQVLDLGNNRLDDEFPCLLKKLSTLQVLVLRKNNFHGPIRCPKMKDIWKMIQIVDLAFNNFNGTVPGKSFLTWKTMMLSDFQNENDLNVLVVDFDFDFGNRIHMVSLYNRGTLVVIPSPGYNYKDQVTITSKGLQMTLNKILTIFTLIDFSSNHFEGPIPEEIMEFRALHFLNLSNNNLSGHIPSSIGKMTQLESLDLSNNSFTGEIPLQLAILSFLEVLNLSYNCLSGKIPTGTQIQSFPASSFAGNNGLCGLPLTQNCSGNPSGPPKVVSTKSGNGFDWHFVLSGVVFGLGIIVGPLFYWKQWRVRYWKLVDNILCGIFPQLYLEYQWHEGEACTVLRWRH